MRLLVLCIVGGVYEQNSIVKKCPWRWLRQPKERSLLLTARKRSLGQGNIFTTVCHSVHGGEGRCIPACIAGGIPACLAEGGLSQHALQEGVVPAAGGLCSGGGGGLLPGGEPGGDPQVATAAGSTHPTGMHSCNGYAVADPRGCSWHVAPYGPKFS